MNHLDARDRRRGFTAIEIAMVATVIAIFALLVLPIFRNRVDDAKVAAAASDLASLHKAETLAQADIGFYLRLQDLDNIQLNPAGNSAVPPPPAGVDLETPPFLYPAPPSTFTARRALTTAEWRNLSGVSTAPKFRGPYISFQRFAPLSDLRAGTINGSQFYVRTINTRLNQSAIWDLDGTDGALIDNPASRIPIDPWGSPYLFFPAAGETPYNNSIIYSMGKDGLPGNGSGAQNAALYQRPTINGPAVLGGDNDQSVQF